MIRYSSVEDALSASAEDEDLLRAALFECATHAGADVSDGPYGMSALALSNWATNEVCQLRREYDECEREALAELEKHIELVKDLAIAVTEQRKWWEPYGPENALEMVKALGKACAYWEAAHVAAIESRDEAWAEVKRLKETETA